MAFNNNSASQIERVAKYLVFSAFFLSGLAGLIYESIWSHYLKLFLGHAAYSQALVLAIFMGGMALGSWLIGKHVHAIRNPLKMYALVEGLIALAGLFFHITYIGITDFSYERVFPLIDSPSNLQLIKWLLGVVLVLPQSILLGATFPLLSSSLIRASAEQRGRTLATLYFSNSFGAAIGVLLSGFILINLVGLPGTILTAAIINTFVAILSWKASQMLATSTTHLSNNQAIEQTRKASPQLKATSVFLTIALITGLSSFIYEIGWIRMLSLVLGSSTHAFELMLSAFIFGLALGGFYVRKRIDSSQNTENLLGWIQIAMGVLAASTLIVYEASFDFMSFSMNSLARTEGGYVFFNLISHIISFAVMLPVTVLAGMTLPIITFNLLKAGIGEKVIGQVYAANTLGAILGAIGAALILMPVIGLKWLILFGSILDIFLGLYLLFFSESIRSKKNFYAATAVSFVVILLISINVQFEKSKLSSGVYRHGKLIDRKVEYYKDGRTASIAVTSNEHMRSIITNGKVDAGVSVVEDKVEHDEYTMVLAGALPLLHKPATERAAVIGLGSGITAQVVLAYTEVKKVDVIEIEPAIVEGAKHFQDRNRLVYEDPRSNIVIDDAKSFFSAQKEKYDLIISEPSNPWVSGVATLFSDEFYSIAKRKLNEDGLLVQWLQIYESSPIIVSSILKALSNNFNEYIIYRAHSDLIIIASPNRKIPAMVEAPFAHTRFKKELARIGISSVEDLFFFYQGSNRTLGASFEDMSVGMNSDFFPVVDQIAAKYRFISGNFTLFDDYQSFVFNLNYLDATAPKLSQEHEFSARLELPFERSPVKSMYRVSYALNSMYLSNSIETKIPLLSQERSHVMHLYATTTAAVHTCSSNYARDYWFPDVQAAATSLAFIRTTEGMDKFWSIVTQHPCFEQLEENSKLMLEILRSSVSGDFPQMFKHSLNLIGDQGSIQASDVHAFAYSAMLYALIAQRRYEEAEVLANTLVGERSFNAKTLERFVKNSIN